VFKSDRILALDIGASRIVLAEFIAGKGGAPELTNYGISQLGIDPESDTDSTPFIVSAIEEVMRDTGIKPGPLLLSMSGQAVFPRYVKLPPVSGDKIRQMIHYEAEQNVPFPIDEVVWDFQLVGGTEEGELNVLLVAAKTDHVTRMTDCVQGADLDPEIVDVGSMALYNAVRFNYPDLEGCTMVLDIGARASNLIFIEEGRIFSRSIPTAGSTVTHEIMKEFDLSFEEAEGLKLKHSFVAFGGVYAGPDDDIADRVSKITRNVVTRLHAEVNRSINFYRSQQGGSAPSLVLLTGGSSVIPHMDTFFREKLKVAVEFLNPFNSVSVGLKVDTARVEADIQHLSQVVGLALRRSLTCPVEINLMPPELVSERAMQRRQPFFALSAVGVALIMLCWWGYTHRMSAALERQHAVVRDKIDDLMLVQRRMSRMVNDRDAVDGDVRILRALVDQRTQWACVFESILAAKLDGMWVTAVEPVLEKRRRYNAKPQKSIKAIDVSLAGFDDKLDQVEEVGGPTAIEQFRDRLRQMRSFKDETEITKEVPMRTGAYEREFTVRLHLETPVLLAIDGAAESEEEED